jgi:hypothetical protein
MESLQFRVNIFMKTAISKRLVSRVLQTATRAEDYFLLVPSFTRNIRPLVIKTVRVTSKMSINRKAVIFR